MNYERAVEEYLRANVRPRWMERLIDIERLTKRARAELAEARAQLLQECGADPDAFRRRWREVAAGWDFSAVNELIARHNDWYPIERDLPMNPRTGEYLPIMGRSYRREELGAAWVLAQFPA